jgi:DNA-binding transcriptional LysR family regulator
LIPTDEAHALFREVEQVYQAALRVDEFARALTLGPTSLLRVSCSDVLATSVVAPAIVALMKQLPRLNIDWHTSLMRDMPQEVLSKTVDLSLSAFPIEHEHLDSVPFLRGRMVCALPRRHRLSRKKTISLTDLADENMILFRSDIPTGMMIVRASEQAGVKLNSVVDVTRAEQALALVNGGLGISIVDEFSASRADVDVRPLVEELEFVSTFVYSKFLPPSRSATLLMDAVQAQARSLGRQISAKDTSG